MKKISATLLVITASTAHASPFFNHGEGRRPVAQNTSDVVLDMFDINPESRATRSSLVQDEEMVSSLAECVDAHAWQDAVSSILLDDFFADRTLLSVVDEGDEESWADALMSGDSDDVYGDEQTDSAVDECLMGRGIHGVEVSVLYYSDADSSAADKSCEEAAKDAWGACMEAASKHGELSDRQEATKECGDTLRVALHDCAKKK